MFDLSFSELLLIGLAALIFIGPKDLPKVLRAIFGVFRQLQDMASEVRRNVNEIVADSGIKDVTKEMEYIVDMDGNLQPTYDLSDVLPNKKPKPADDEPS